MDSMILFPLCINLAIIACMGALYLWLVKRRWKNYPYPRHRSGSSQNTDSRMQRTKRIIEFLLFFIIGIGLGACTFHQ